MQVKGIVTCALALLLTGCNSQEIKPEFADASGKYDGGLDLDFTNKNGLQTFGRVHYTCSTQSVGRSYIVENGLIWADDSDESVGVISSEGDLYIRQLGGSYSNDTGGKRHSYILVSGKFDEKLNLKGRMTLAYGESTQGCGYEAEGYIFATNVKHDSNIFTKSQRLPVDLVWGNETYEGIVEISERLVRNSAVDVVFKSPASDLSCEGRLKTDSRMIGSWVVECNNGKTASGKYFQSSYYWSLSGNDQDGTSVTAFENI